MTVENCFKQGKSVILEGFHLHHGFQTQMIEKYGKQCLCFVINLKDCVEHIKKSQAILNGEPEKLEIKEKKLLNSIKTSYDLYQKHLPAIAKI